jgi:PAT family beta-lactamase induction signal transducer AmpG
VKLGTLSLRRLKDNFGTTLSEKPLTRYFAFSFLYFAQGIPEGLTFYAIPAWLAMNGATPVQIGSYLAMAGLPWSLKLIIAPMMDRFTIKSMGRKRPWVIFGQIGLILSFSLLVLVDDPVEDISLLMGLVFLVSTMGCFQDVATDGMAVDIIPPAEQARANGLMWGSKILGISASLGISSYIMNTYGFSWAVFVPAGFISLILMVPIFFRERPGEKILPWMKGQASLTAELLQVDSFLEILKDVYKVFVLRSSLVLAFAAFFIGAGAGYLEAVFPSFTIQEIGWTNTHYSNLVSTSTIIAGISGMIIGGFIVDKFGKKKVLYINLSLLILSVGGFIFYRSAFFTEAMVTLIIGSTFVLFVFVNIAVLASAMQHCWLRVSATQFTLYMTVYNLGRSSGAGVFGPIKENFDWPYVFLAFGIMLLMPLMAIGFIRIHKHVQAVKVLEEHALLEVHG